MTDKAKNTATGYQKLTELRELIETQDSILNCLSSIIQQMQPGFKPDKINVEIIDKKVCFSISFKRLECEGDGKQDEIFKNLNPKVYVPSVDICEKINLN